VAAAALEIADLAAYSWAAYISCSIVALFSRRDVWLVSDRSFDDVLIKHKRLGSLPLPVLRRVRKLAPGATTTIWLQTEPDVAMQRDGEFEPQYYEEMNRYYAAAADEEEWQVISTSNRSAEAIAEDVAGVLSHTAECEAASGEAGG
jgi:thymidylate kinase